MHHSDNTKGTSSYPFILEHLCIQTLSDSEPQNCFHLHASRAGSFGEILWYTAGRWGDKLFVWQFWLKGSYLWNALSVVALTLRLWVTKQCQKPVTSEEGLCRKRNVPNTSHIIRGFLKSEQAWESDREKPSTGWVRGGGDELKRQSELWMPPKFPYGLIIGASSVCFADWIAFFMNCESRTSLL